MHLLEIEKKLRNCKIVKSHQETKKTVKTYQITAAGETTLAKSS
jgi:DNA-binding PadR family transcriptional regulator